MENEKEQDFAMRAERGRGKSRAARIRQRAEAGARSKKNPLVKSLTGFN